MKIPFTFGLLLFLSGLSWGQDKLLVIDTNDFRDAAHHWYDIRDKSNTVNPRAGHPTYRANQVAAIADNILLYQKVNGGWPKNYDMQGILTPAQKDSLLKAKNELHTTFDNGSTYAQVAYLAKAFTFTRNELYKNAVEAGLDFIIAAQFRNGGWPQYYPLENNYSRYITFNDDAYTGIMKLLKDFIDAKPGYQFIGTRRYTQLLVVFNNGLQCILQTQVNDMGKPTAWCQQYDEITLQPAWARKFEPPGICNNESAGIVLFLMDIHHPSTAVMNAIKYAVAWFNESAIADTKVVTVDAPEMVTPFTISRHDKVVVPTPGAPPIWTRYYERTTHRPIFCNRNSIVVYSLAEVDRERRDGYGWYTYEPQKVLDRYPAWKKKWL